METFSPQVLTTFGQFGIHKNLWTCQILPIAVLHVKLCGPACDHKINQRAFYIDYVLSFSPPLV